MLIVQPWDKGLIGEIEKAIRNSELGLNPANDGNIIRVPVPALNEERRREMVKLLHKIAEEGRIAVRNIRHEANKKIHAAQKSGDISEDEMHRQLKEVQDLTDEHIRKIDEMLERKEKEVMEV
jgi:ribosome recycling factor